MLSPALHRLFVGFSSLFVWFVMIQTGILMLAASGNMLVFLLADKLWQDNIY